MRIHSIRWRLTLSYAAIACLAAVALGTVLLAILRGYYSDRERAYLNSNSASLRTLVTSAIAQDVPVSALTPQLQNLAFFSKVRIRVLDDQGAVLVDTGTPDEPQMIWFAYSSTDQAPGGLQVQTIRLAPYSDLPTGFQPGTWEVPGEALRAVAAAPDVVDTFIQAASGHLPGGGGAIAIEQSVPATSTTVVGAAGGVDVLTVDAMSALPLSSTMYGFSLGGGTGARISERDANERSDQQIRSDIFDVNARRVGALVISDGPAYGSEIVRSVARGWALAGGISVLLAAAAGWFVSRQISKPLLVLTGVTARMTAGDLSTRANVERQDELGILAASFNTMADRIQEIVVTLQRFVADAAHELHTPLTALRTNLELAQSGHSPAAIRRAHEQVLRLENLTDGLLVLSRIESHAPNGQIVPINLVDMIHSMSELYASRAEQAGLDYAVSLPEQVPYVSGHQDQIASVISNLMDNAIKFTPPGGTVRLTLQQVDQTLELAVQDTGIGIPPDDLSLLFERFRRGRNAASYPGSGLGLAITKAIVKTHGGTIRAESSSAGTTIRVVLPVA